MTENSDGSAYVTPPRMHTEYRPNDPSRAVVINYTLAWMIFVVALGALISGVVWVTTIDNRVTAIEARRTVRDSQFETIGSRFDALEQRVRPLEVTAASTAASLAFIRDQVVGGFNDINRRLDRLQDGSKP